MPRRNHVVFVNRVFPPDSGASGQYLSALVSAFDKDHWRVTVVTTKTVSGTHAESIFKEVEVRRVRGLPFRRKWLWYRGIAYLSLYPALFIGLLKVARPDTIVVMTDPPLFLAVATLYGKCRNIPVVHWCQDLYPELVFNVGFLKRDGAIGRALMRIRDGALNRCASIVAIGRCMASILSERTTTPVHNQPNWADIDNIRPVPHVENPFRKKLLAASDGQIVMYSGNFGLAHPFAAIIAAAEELNSQSPNVRFVFIGDGPRLPSLRSEVAKRRLKNVSFLPYQPQSELSYTLSAADLHLACMEHGMLGLAVPSKVYGIFAAGRPCIFIGPTESEAAMLINESQAGEVLPPGCESALGSRVRDWLEQPRTLDLCGKNARAAAEQVTLSHAAIAFQLVLTDTISLHQLKRRR
jgi:colanic acid biosynthesis glycosyl transferase WcaI